MELPRILCVDDEPRVLEGLALNLRRRFALTTAGGGVQGLAALTAGPAFAVVVSDMRMPGMDGATFLARIRESWPETVCMLLTGEMDLTSAIAAVNEGQIFRFLSKPCSPALLARSIDGAVAQHRLITAERELFEETLRGSIGALVDVLSLATPLAFGRATRVKRLAGQLALALDLKDRWAVDVAAMLSQLGNVVLPPSMVEKVADGETLSALEQDMVDKVPATSRQILGDIPRLDLVREILDGHARAFTPTPATGLEGPSGEHIPIGARVLRVALDFDQLDGVGLRQDVIAGTLRARPGLYDPRVLAALDALIAAAGTQGARGVTVAELRAGMIVAEDVKAIGGAILIARGHEITESSLQLLLNCTALLGVQEPIQVVGVG